jgi:long-subunit acyl-CoA synthetase (AMP-forming)
MAQQTLCSHFQATVAAHADQVALRTSDGGTSLTWSDYDARVRSVAAGLAAIGVRAGETVALMLTNRPEFNVVDAAAFHLGAIPFSAYNTSSAAQVNHMFTNAENRVVVCEEQFLSVVETARVGTKVDHVVTIEGGPADVMTLAELERAGDPAFDFDEAWRSVGSDDVLTLIYTSGTTGPPKGVELTHANMLASIASVSAIVSADHTDRAVSYLPDAHLVNRYVAHYLPATSGMQVTTVSDAKTLLGVLTEVRPTFFVAVPMLWYKIKAALESAVDAEPEGMKKRLALWAIGAGRRAAALESRAQSLPITLKLQHALADRLVLSKLTAKLGLDEVRVAISGAAPIAEEAMEFILGLGVPVCEAWGMSELSAVATLNRPGAIRIGSVGTPVEGAEVRLAEDGELLVRGPLVMKGYRNDPEKTAEAIDADGWMHTGDIGTIDEEGFVRIVDRKKELIINSGGKNMSPANIENHVKVASSLIGSVVAIGDDRKYVTALIALEPDAAAAFATAHGLADASPGILASEPTVRAALDQAIATANEQLSRVEQIKKYAVVPSFWEPGGDELTPTMKLKRKPISEKYAAEIESLYA